MGILGLNHRLSSTPRLWIEYQVWFYSECVENTLKVEFHPVCAGFIPQLCF